ncbi:MAG: glycosyltransferase [Thermoanaerobaculia bacterium]|nr:glycosyltransferase [Thermoanaerobaculia bacterium]
MRVALVHDWLTGMRGGEKVLEEIGDLVPEAPIYSLFHFPGSVSDRIEAHPIRTSFLQRAPFVRRHYRRYLGLFPAAVESFDLTGFDLVVSTSHCVAKGIVPGPEAVHLCYCFTPMRYAWDQEHVYFPRRRGLTARIRGLILSRLRVWDVASNPRVDRFLTTSSFVAGRIRRYYGREAEVVPPPVDTGFFHPAEPGEREDYCLAVAAAVPYKRLDLAIRACQRLGLQLRIVATGPDRRRLEGIAGPETRFLGPIPRDELRTLYRKARCFVQPGIEDFGIASVEALACGTPVVALARGGVLDIVEDGVHGVLYQGFGEVEPLVRGIDRCRDLRFNSLDLHRRASEFSTAGFRDRFRSCLPGGFESSLEDSPP